MANRGAAQVKLNLNRKRLRLNWYDFINLEKALKRRSRGEYSSYDEDDDEDRDHENNGEEESQDITDDSKSARPSSHSGPPAEESTAEVWHEDWCSHEHIPFIRF